MYFEESSSLYSLDTLHLCLIVIRPFKILEGPPFFDFPRSWRKVGEKEENFQHGDREPQILENIAPDT